MCVPCDGESICCSNRVYVGARSRPACRRRGLRASGGLLRPICLMPRVKSWRVPSGSGPQPCCSMSVKQKKNWCCSADLARVLLGQDGLVAGAHPDELDKVGGADGGEDVPPAVQLERPGPGGADEGLDGAEVEAELEVDVPDGVADDEVPKGAPKDLHHAALLLLGTAHALDEVEGAGPHEGDHGEEGDGVDADVAGADVDDGDAGDDGNQKGRDEEAARGTAVDGVQRLEKGAGEEEHGQVVKVLGDLAHGAVEGGGADADGDEGVRHEVEPVVPWCAGTRRAAVADGAID